MKQRFWYLVACLGLLVTSNVNIKAMQPSVPSITENPEDLARATQRATTIHHTTADMTSPETTMPTELPTIPESAESEASSMQATPASDVTTLQSSGNKPPRGHKRTGGVDLGHHAIPHQVKRQPHISLTIHNTLHRDVTAHLAYTAIILKGIPPLPPVHQKLIIAPGHKTFQIGQSIRRGKEPFRQTLALTTIQFIDTKDNTVIKTIDAATLTHPEMLTNITLGVSGKKPPLYPRTDSGYPVSKKEKEPTSPEKTMRLSPDNP